MGDRARAEVLAGLTNEERLQLLDLLERVHANLNALVRNERRQSHRCGRTRADRRRGRCVPAPQVASAADDRRSRASSSARSRSTTSLHGATSPRTTRMSIAARVAISTNVPGRVVVQLEVRDNQRVKRGDVLFRLDDRPFQLAVSEAQARLDQAMLEVEAMKATYRQKQSELRSARDTLELRAARERAPAAACWPRAFPRRRRWIARCTRGMPRRRRSRPLSRRLRSVLANLGGDPSIDARQHPSVEQAQAALDRAKLDLSYTTVHCAGRRRGHAGREAARRRLRRTRRVRCSRSSPRTTCGWRRTSRKCSLRACGRASR